MDRNEAYKSLRRILDCAYSRSAYGKGIKRHGSPEVPWDGQNIVTIQNITGPNGPMFQIIKKLQESQRLPAQEGILELLDCIVYTAGIIRFMELMNRVQVAPETEEPAEGETLSAPVAKTEEKKKEKKPKREALKQLLRDLENDEKK